MRRVINYHKPDMKWIPVYASYTVCPIEVTSLPRYLVTSLPRYLVTSLPRYLVTSLPRYLVTSLPRYLVTSLPRYLDTSLHRYLVTSLHRYIVTSLHRYIVTSLHRYIVTSLHRPLRRIRSLYPAFVNTRCRYALLYYNNSCSLKEFKDELEQEINNARAQGAR